MQETETRESAGTESSESAGTGHGEKVEVNRSAEEYARKLSEFAKENEKRRKKEAELKKQNEELYTRLKELEDAKASEQGQFKDAWERTKKELEEVKANAKKERAAYAYKVVTNQFARAAEAAGCTNSEHLIKFGQALGLMNEIDVDESTFEVTQDSLKSVIEKAQKEIPYLFGKTAPLVKDGTPKTPDTKVSLSDLPFEKRLQMLAEKSANGEFQKTSSNN